MATWQDVADVALALPGVTAAAGESRSWTLRGTLLVWERPLRKADRAALGDAAPTGDVIGVRVPDLDAKDAALASVSGAFTTPHFDGYPAVLVVLATAAREDLEELVTEAWLARATKRAVKAWLDEHPP